MLYEAKGFRSEVSCKGYIRYDKKKKERKNHHQPCTLTQTSGPSASLAYRTYTAKDICSCKCCICHAIHSSSRCRHHSSGHAVCHRACCKHPYRALPPADKGNKMSALVIALIYTVSSNAAGRPAIRWLLCHHSTLQWARVVLSPCGLAWKPPQGFHLAVLPRPRSDRWWCSCQNRTGQGCNKVIHHDSSVCQCKTSAWYNDGKITWNGTTASKAQHFNKETYEERNSHTRKVSIQT